MNSTIESDRSIVQRMGAERYLLLTLVSFAASVITTRTFLSLTGYPQLGNSELHIAHVLWGGLLLFISGLLPLILANAWAYSTGAVLNGVGMGLFIDEIGKFITQTNDYFYPPAAPIIYSFFLLTVMLYLYIRRPTRRSPRRVMYQVLHDMGEVIDHDLQPGEKTNMIAQLDNVIHTAPGTNLSLLAVALKNFLDEETLHLSEHLPNWQRRWLAARQSFRERIQSNQGGRRRFRWTLAFLLIISGLLILARLSLLSVSIAFQGGLIDWMVEFVRTGVASTPGELRWGVVRIVLESGFALLLAISGLLLLFGREQLTIRLAALSLVMLLTTVDLLVFYFDQFAAMATALAQFSLLLLVLIYRRWYLDEEGIPDPESLALPNPPQVVGENRPTDLSDSASG